MNTTLPTMNKTRLAELIAKMRASKVTSTELTEPPQEVVEQITVDQITDKHGAVIQYNEKQDSFVKLGATGQSCVLIGAAGTGKTTCMKGVTQALIQSGLVGILQNDGHKHLTDGTPGIIICAYTRRATNNIRKNLSKDLQGNCITIHKLLEYAPVYNEVIDPETGEGKTKMSFEPSRTILRPLPPSIRTIIFEEASMIGTDLYKEVINAIPHSPQLIFLGDIQQLPPVFGPAILGFKLLSLPVVELTEVYRQALESPIISLAHRILSGIPINKEEFPDWKFPGKLTIHPWKKKITPDLALATAAQFFIAANDAGGYDPEEDIILLPFNKAFGTEELNKKIANHLARKRSAVTYEVIAGFNKHYFSSGDKVMYEKEDAEIVSIETNVAYTGAKFLPCSPTLDYWGYDPVEHAPEVGVDSDMDFLLAQVAGSDSDRVRQASHTLTLRMLDSDVEVKIDKAAELNSLLLGYALTVHKSQGSEWRRVFFVTHQSHATMLQRELLYTAVTRAKEELYIICEPECFVNGIKSQRVKGDTLAEKAVFFQGKLDSGTNYGEFA